MKNISLPSGFHRVVLFAALFVHVITAWYSTGYYSADEHFQVIAFAQAKLGELPVEHLPWEYDTGIRSSVQPWIAVSVFRALGMIGITDPFTRTLVLRLLTALLALLVVRAFIRAVLGQVPAELKKPFILLSYLLWFLPFLHVRFSSEGWSGIFLLFGLGELMRLRNREENRRGAEAQRNEEPNMRSPDVTSRKGYEDRSPLSLLWAGVAFGIAVLCRPPVGLIVVCALLWLVLQARMNVWSLRWMLGGLVVMMLIGLGLDSAFYDRPLLSTFEYVRMGFAGDPDHRFDELPWYYYPPWVVKYAIPPIGLCIVLALAMLIWKRPSNLLVWCIVPFVLAHSFIPHKELRFIFPLADLVPLVVVLGLTELRPWIKAGAMRPLGKVLVWVLIVCNILGLSVVMTSASGIGRTVLAEELHAIQPTSGSKITYVIDPMQAWRVSLPAFYLPAEMTDSAFTLSSFTGGKLHMHFLVARSTDADQLAAHSGQQLHPIARTESAWTEHFMRWYTWAEGPEPWTLYRVLPMDP